MKPAIWSDSSVKGCKRFLDRVWKLQDFVKDETGYSKEHTSLMHKTIKKVSQDLEAMKYNTAIAAMMTAINEFNASGYINRDELRDFVILLNPIAPHITEEIWENQGFGGMLNQTSWPVWNEDLTVDEEIEMPVQFNGKVRVKSIFIHRDADISVAKEILAKDEKLMAFMEGKTVVKEIFVNGKIFNIVVK